ncbi:MAG: hypothetical protein J0I32_15415 [Sphingobacteriales bacterium]|jgi:hypothetical protein|nr:hypothetical protein [Sphingobacteriales bacterium]
MALGINLKELENNFVIYGLTLIGGLFSHELFVKGKNYDGFLIKQKTNL